MVLVKKACWWLQMKNKILNGMFNLTQKTINIAYSKKGASDRVIDAQVKLNQMRHKHDLPDKNELIDEEFVQ